MPFASKFRAMMDFPFAGETLGSFTVESVDVRDDPDAAGSYAYSVRMTLRGPGGQQGVRRALKPLFSSHPTTFSWYGTPYQLWFGKAAIESLGDKRYAVSVAGAAARVFLADDLLRFLAYLAEESHLATRPGGAFGQTLVEAYLERYRADIKRKVDRYASRLQSTKDT